MIDLIESNIKVAIEAAKAGKRVVEEDAASVQLVTKYLEAAQARREQVLAEDESNWSIRRALVTFIRERPWVSGRDCVAHIHRSRPAVQNDTVFSTLSRLGADGRLRRKLEERTGVYVYALAEEDV